MSLMGKTLQVAADRAHDETKTVVPAEVARGIYIENPPSAQALKLLLLLIAHAGGRMADPVQHERRMADLKHIEGMRHHNRASLTPLFAQLRGAVLVFDDKEAKEDIIDGFVDRIRVVYGDEAGEGLVVRWRFGELFRDMAAASDIWAILDRQTILALRSRYSLLLFQHIASLAGLSHVSSKTFTIPELRAVLGIERGTLGRFADLNRRAIQPAIAEINQLSRLHLTAKPRKVGRTVASMEIAWAEKPPALETKAQREGTVEQVSPESWLRAVFPETGGIAYNPRWLDLKRAAGCDRDNLLIGSDFRAFLKKRGIRRDAVNIEQVFTDWCRAVGKA